MPYELQTNRGPQMVEVRHEYRELDENNKPVDRPVPQGVVFIGTKGFYPFRLDLLQQGLERLANGTRELTIPAFHGNTNVQFRKGSTSVSVGMYQVPLEEFAAFSEEMLRQS